MIALSDVTVGVVLLVGIIAIGILSLLPSRRIREFHLQGKTAFRLVGVFVLFGVVFFWWMQSQKEDIEAVAEGAVELAFDADALSALNEDRIEDIERVREDAEYTACIDRNDTRQRVRGEYGSLVAQEEANLERIRSSPTIDLTQLPGYSDLQDPAAAQMWDSASNLLILSQEESIRLQEVKVEAAKASLNNYIEAEPFEQCGDDPIPNADPVRPPITADLPQETIPPATTTSTTTTTTTTIPPSTTTRPQPTAPATAPPTVAPTVPRTNPPTTTTEDRPGNGNGGGNGNAGGNGNGNGNGNGGGNGNGRGNR